MKLFVFLCLVLSTLVLAQEEESEALRVLRLACEKQKVALGCFNYANMLVREEKPDQADKYYEMGCKLSHAPSCSKEKWDLPERKPEPSAHNEISSEPAEDLNSATPEDAGETEPSFSE